MVPNCELRKNKCWRWATADIESKAKDQAILEDHEGIALINRSHNTDLKHREFENLTAHKYTENPPLVFFMFFKLYKW